MFVNGFFFCKNNGNIEKLIGIAEHKQDTYYRIYRLYSFHLFSLYLKGEGRFEEVAVYRQVKFPFLQFGETLGYRKSKSASLGVS